MSYNPGHTTDNSGTDPDKGMKTRPYLKMVLGALFVLLAIGFIAARLISHTAPPIKSGTTSSADNKPSSAPQ